MKKLVILIVVAMQGMLYGQDEPMNKWSVSAKFGANKPVNPYALGYFSNTFGFPSFQLGTRYMGNPYTGIEVQLSANRFKFDQFGIVSGSKNFTSRYLGITVLAATNLGEILKIEDFAPRIGLLFSSGVGFSTHYNDSLHIFKDKGSDEMVNFQFQLMPMYHLTPKVSLVAQLNLSAHLYQDLTYDMTSKVLDRGIDGFLITGTVGVNYSIGKHKNDIEWFSEQKYLQDQLAKKQSLYDSLVSNMNDDDKDGVPDYLDLEKGSVTGAVVDNHGMTVSNELVVFDPTKDIAFESVDNYVEFPEKMELFYTVQVGYYELSDSVDYVSEFGLEAVRKELPNGAVRYLHGSFDDLKMASEVRDVIFSGKVTGAFVTAYFKGKRISIAESEKLIRQYGKRICYPMPLSSL